MSELQAYYDAFRTGYWATEDATKCPCHGGGWALSDVDTWHKCPVHYKGQLHPEDYHEDETPEDHEKRQKISIARHTKQVDSALVEAGVQLPTGEVACGYCGEFGHPHGRCPPVIPDCPECGDGAIFSPEDCPRCKSKVQQEIWKDMPSPDDEELPF